jgi:TPR repeat protein
MSSGNFAVVFKMKDEATGKLHAVKCFLKEQEGRAEAYRMIAEELEFVNSTFLTPIKYLDKELFVDTNNSNETEFPVLLMDWIEGKTLDKYIREHIDDQYELSLLAYQFSRLAMWLMPQPFAHGDLKPDNILVKDDGTLALVDYDGMYVPAMKGQKARELGSPDFRHPSRTEDDFDEHIDDFSLVSILLSLKAIALTPELLNNYGSSEHLLFSQKDYQDIKHSDILKHIFPSDNIELNIIYGLFLLVYSKVELTSNTLLDSLNIIENNMFKRAQVICHGSRYDTNANELFSKSELPIVANKILAFRLFKILAIMNCSDAQCCMGCLLWSQDSDPDKLESISWYKKALDNGNERALKQIRNKGEELYKKGSNNPSLFQLSYRLFKLSAEYGDQYSIAMLGFCYENGLGTPIDSNLSELWYNKITQGSGAYTIGKKYFEGENVSVNFRKAVKWFNKAIEMGDLSAYPYLAICYNQGLGIDSKNDHYANELFSKATSEGFSDLVGFYFDKDDYIQCCKLLKIWYPKIKYDSSDYYDAEDYKYDLKEKGYFSEVTNEDLANAWTDKYGSKYSKDKKRLLKASGYYIDKYPVIQETIVICDKAFGYPVKNISSVVLPFGVKIIGDRAFSGNSGLKVINIPDSVTLIGNEAFERCSSLFSVSLPKNITELSNRLFYHCQSLSSIIIPNKVKRIGHGAFKYCNGIFSGLTSIVIPDSVEEIGVSAFYGCKKLTTIKIPDSVLIIGSSAFRDCEGITNITIPSKVTSIERETFYACKELTMLVMSDNVTSIGDHAFWCCEKLKSVNLSDSLQEIGESAFYGCEALKDIIFPNSLRHIGADAFWNCYSLSSLSIPNSISQIGNRSFLGCSGLKIISLPNSVTSIGDEAFYGCSTLEHITIPDTITHIGKDAFSGCNSLCHIKIPLSLTQIGEDAFEGLKCITQITIPQGIIGIQKGAFSHCIGLEHVVIPDSVEQIDDWAFSDCYALKTITIPDSLISIGRFAFYDCISLKKVIIPKGSKKKFEIMMPYYSDILEEQVDILINITDASNQDFASAWTDEYGVLYSCDRKRLIKAPENLNNYSIRKGTEIVCDGAFKFSVMTNLTIPDSIAIIGNGAFLGCSNLSSIVIPNSVTEIGDYAFSGCIGLTSVAIPASITNIGKGAFEGCLGLTSIVVDKNNNLFDSRNDCNAIIETNNNCLISACCSTIIPDSVISIGERAFSHCMGLTSIIIPDGVTIIGDHAFSFCSGLTSITIPDSVTSIGNYAFYGCSGFSSISLPISVNIIRDGTFGCCSKLHTFSIPNGVTTIGDGVFCRSGICSIDIPNSVVTIGNQVFYGCDNMSSITLPSSVTSIGDFSCTTLRSIFVPLSSRDKFQKMLPKYSKLF